MRGQLSFIPPYEAQQRDLSHIRIPEAPIILDDVLDQWAESQPAIDGQLVLEIGDTVLRSVLEDPSE